MPKIYAECVDILEEIQWLKNHDIRLGEEFERSDIGMAYIFMQCVEVTFDVCDK